MRFYAHHSIIYNKNRVNIQGCLNKLWYKEINIKIPFGFCYFALLRWDFM